MKKVLSLILLSVLLLAGCEKAPSEVQSTPSNSASPTATVTVTPEPSASVEGENKRPLLENEPIPFPERQVKETAKTGFIPAFNKGSEAVGVVLQIEGEEEGKYIVRASDGKTYTVNKEKVTTLDVLKDIRDVDINSFKARPYDELFPAKNTVFFDDGSYIIQLRDVLIRETDLGEADKDFVQVASQEEFASFYFTKDGEYISYLPAFKDKWIHYAKKYDFNRDGIEDIFGISLPIEDSTEKGLDVKVDAQKNKSECNKAYEDVKLYVNLSLDGTNKFASDSEGLEPDSILNPLCDYALLDEEMYSRNQKVLHLLDKKIMLDASGYPQWEKEPYCDKCIRLYNANR